MRTNSLTIISILLLIGLSFAFEVFEEYTETNPTVLSTEVNILEVNRYRLRLNLLKAFEQHMLFFPEAVLDIQLLSAVYVMSHRLKNKMMTHCDYEMIYEFYSSLTQNKDFRSLVVPPEYYNIEYSAAITNISPMFFISLVFLRIQEDIKYLDHFGKDDQQYKILILQYYLLCDNAKLILHLFDNHKLPNIGIANNYSLYSSAVMNHTYLILICIKQLRLMENIETMIYGCYCQSFIYITTQFVLNTEMVSASLMITSNILTSAITKINDVCEIKLSTYGIVNWKKNIKNITQALNDINLPTLSTIIARTTFRALVYLYCEIMVPLYYNDFNFDLIRIFNVIWLIKIQTNDLMDIVIQHQRLIDNKLFLYMIVSIVSIHNFVICENNDYYLAIMSNIHIVGNQILKYLQSSQIVLSQMIICIIKKYITACLLCRKRKFSKLNYVLKNKKRIEFIYLNDFTYKMHLQLKHWTIIESTCNDCISKCLETNLVDQQLGTNIFPVG